VFQGSQQPKAAKDAVGLNLLRQNLDEFSVSNQANINH
jgi:hypothetical protein